jgi:hypothetical protein
MINWGNRAKTVSHRLEKSASQALRIALFESMSLKGFLEYVVEVVWGEKGIRTRLARAAQCQPSYFSQVLSGDAQLSHEQVFGIAQYLGFDASDWEYLSQLTILAKTNHIELKQQIENQLLQLRTNAMGRVDGLSSERKFSEADLMWYVSSWQNSAVLAAIDSPKMATRHGLSKSLGIDSGRINEIVDGLKTRSILTEDQHGHLKSNLPETIFLGNLSAGQIFRQGWLARALGKTHEGYHNGVQKGGVFLVTKREYEELKDEVLNLHRKFFSRRVSVQEPCIVGYFGIEVFEA